MRNFLKYCLFAGISFLSVLFMSCSANYRDLGNETVDGWLVMHDKTITSAEKSLKLADQMVTLTIIGSDVAINKVLSGEWIVGAGNNNEETILFSGDKNAENVEVRTRDEYTLNFTVRFSSPQSKATNIGGSLGPGNYVWFERSNVWWGASAWTEPATGDVDLYMYKNDWGTWNECDRSELDGLQQDNVSHNHGVGWQSYKIKVKAKDGNSGNSIFTGQLSW